MILYICYITILIICSVNDIKYRKVNNISNMFISILGILLSVSGSENIIYKLIGVVAFTIPILFIATITDGMGGGDVKYIFSNGLVLGLYKMYFGTLLAFVLVLIFYVVKKWIIKKVDKEIAMIPFLSLGYFIVLFIA